MQPDAHLNNADNASSVEADEASFSCQILTLFPEFFASPLNGSIIRRARASGALKVDVHDIRTHTTDKHRSADDNPYGGGAGMLLKPEPIARCIEAVESQTGRLHRILMTPQGNPFCQKTAARLAKQKGGIMILCGHYEGIDERIREHFIDEEISIGDYVLTGGEPAALVLIDAVIRLRPGVLGNADSTVDESFSEGLLEYPQYTRPKIFREHSVPEVLTSGHHQNIARWRRDQALLRTLRRRPELLQRLLSSLSQKERNLLANEEGERWQTLIQNNPKL